MSLRKGSWNLHFIASGQSTGNSLGLLLAFEVGGKGEPSHGTSPQPVVSDPRSKYLVSELVELS